MTKIKVSKFALNDMLKFKNLPKAREKAIQNTIPEEITGEFTINHKANHLHPDYLDVVVKETIEHKEANAKTFIFGLKNDEPLPYFRAGQYITLKLEIDGSSITRSYSLSSSPSLALKGRYAITVKAFPFGFASLYLVNNLKVGDELTISSPQGDFYYQNLRDKKDVLAVVGGSCITPFLSMAYAIKDGIEHFNLTILYGARTKNDILFKDEIDKLVAETDKIKVIYVISDEIVEGCEHGLLTKEIIGKYKPDDCSIFVCGPGPMYPFIQKELNSFNLPKRLIRSEAMGITTDVSSEPNYPIDAKDKVFCLTIKQGPNEYHIKASSNEPILIAIERAGIKVPSRCRGGQCGWCRSRVTAGTYFISGNDARRFSDKTSNQIHPCCTFPTSDMIIEIPGDYNSK